MIEKVLNHKKLFVLITLLAPVLCIVFGLLIVKWCALVFVSDNPLVNIDPTQKISSVDIISLYLSILGIIVGAYITIAIFYMQMKEEMDKLLNIMSYYQTEIINSLNKVFNEDYDNISLDLGHWIEVSSQIKDKIGEKKFNVINELCIDICNSRTTRKNEFLEKYYIDFYKFFRKYIDKNEFFIQDFLVSKVLDSIESLGKKTYKNNVILKKDNSLFCEMYSKNNSIMYKCNTDKIKCDCSFNNGVPWNGYIRQYGKTMYDGKLRDGKKNGTGKLFHGIHLLEEGEYQDDILINGKIYGLELIDKKEITNPLKLIFYSMQTQQVYKDFEPLSDETDERFVKYLKIADYQVVNGCKTLISESVRDVKVVDIQSKMAATYKEFADSVKEIKIPNIKL